MSESSPGRSPGLRKVLAGSLNAEQVQRAFQKEDGDGYISEERRTQLRRNLEEARVQMVDFEQRHQALLEDYAGMSDAEFDQAYQFAATEFEEILAGLSRWADEYQREHRPYTVEFTDLAKIESLKQFLDAFPMQFIPRKEEVGRMLAFATQMHDERMRRGEKRTGEPITIVDIGGASGALGKLITDLARENGLDIEYTVVDPDAPTVRAASEFYRQHPSLRFRELKADEFIAEQYRGDPQMVQLLAERSAMIQEGERKRADLGKLVKDIRSRVYALTPSAISGYMDILKADFGIEAIPTSFVQNRNGFLEMFDDQIDQETGATISFLEGYTWRYREQVRELTRAIEARLAALPPQHDLVINSWMPVQMDLTRSVREAHGAAVLYALERYGATGCRSDSPYPERPPSLGDDESYHPGTAYESQLGWISHATPQVNNMERDQPERLWEYQSSWTPPFANGFVVQTKRGYGAGGLSVRPVDLGLVVDGRYPWEDELTRCGGDISPTVPLRDAQGELNYFEPFGRLADRLEVEERRKATMLRGVGSTTTASNEHQRNGPPRPFVMPAETRLNQQVDQATRSFEDPRPSSTWIVESKETEDGQEEVVSPDDLAGFESMPDPESANFTAWADQKLQELADSHQYYFASYHAEEFFRDLAETAARRHGHETYPEPAIQTSSRTEAPTYGGPGYEDYAPEDYTEHGEVTFMGQPALTYVVGGDGYGPSLEPDLPAIREAVRSFVALLESGESRAVR